MCVRPQLTVMTTIPQLRMALRTGDCVKKNPNTTRDPTYAQKSNKKCNINNRARMPSIVRTTSNNTSTYPQDKRILRGDISHPTYVANEHREDAAISRTIERPAGITSRSRGTSNNRGHCSSGSDEDGPTKRCRRTKGAERTRHRRSKIKQKMQQARLRRPERPERRNSPENQARNARVNPHPSDHQDYHTKMPCRINHPSRLASRHRHRYTVPKARVEKWHRIKLDVKTWQVKGCREKKKGHEHKV